MKLYHVKLRGQLNYDNKGNAYVVANDPKEALEKVLKYINDKNLGFTKDREMDTITMIADEYDYSNCQHKLYL